MGYLEKAQPLWNLISEIANDEGVLLYDAELLNPSALRVSIAPKEVKDLSPVADENVSADAEEPNADGHAGKDGAVSSGVSSGDCTRVCRRLMVVMQAEGMKFGVHPEAEIDVSSPGINRDLRLREHFEGAVGQRVKVVLRPEGEAESESGIRLSALLGILERAENGKARLVDENVGEGFDFAIESVKRANVEFKFAR